MIAAALKAVPARWWAGGGLLLALAGTAGVQTLRLAGARADLAVEQGAHKVLQADVKAQADAAKKLLDQRTAERDAKQAEIDAAAAAQEERDAETKLELARLSGELRDRPVRVRYVVAPGGGGGGGGAGEASAAAGAGAGDAGAATGLLPAANSRRLADVIAEVEQMSAAYGSCRAQIMR